MFFKTLLFNRMNFSENFISEWLLYIDYIKSSLSENMIGG